MKKKFCKRGHASSALPDGRYAAGKGNCKECMASRHVEKGEEIKVRRAKYRAENRGAARAYGKKRYAENPERARAVAAKWARDNSEKVRAWQAKYRADNPETIRTRRAKRHAENRDVENARSAKWRKDNLEKKCALEASRRAMKLQQRCVCCTDFEIQWFYDIRPKGHDVDHITPLALGGPHCVRNLEVLHSRSEHREKTARDHAAMSLVRRRTRLLREWSAHPPLSFHILREQS